jgi:hypothetical protein
VKKEEQVSHSKEFPLINIEEMRENRKSPKEYHI